MQTSEAASRQIPVIEGRLSEFSNDPISCMRRVQNAGGNLIAMEEDGQQIVFAFGAELNRQILSRGDSFHSQFFAIRGPKHSAQRRLTSGLLSMNGREHSQQRRSMKDAFEKRAIPGYAEMIKHHAHNMLDNWRPGRTLDISSEMTDLMLRISSSMLFGMVEPELAFEIGGMMQQWVKLNHEMGIAALVSEEDFYPRYQHLLLFAEKLEVRIRELISHRSAKDVSSGHDVISLLLRATQAGAPMTESQLVGQTALVFAASQMTTAHTLTWTLLLLAQHPEVMQDLVAHVSRRPESSIHNGLPDSAPGIVPGGSANILDRVIRESMRVLPASAYSQRVTNGPTELNGVPLKANSLVIFSQFMTHRNELVFESASKFRPNRWKTIRPTGYEYLPFGGGARLCLGAPLAMSILNIVLPMTLRQAGLQVVPGTEVNGRVISTMLSPESAIPVRLLEPGTVAATSPLAGNINDLVTPPISAVNRAAA
ncbi:MAG: cytochrome P450 [Planctomycetota bacterium]|nr:cytochrome P450 [Planctomycetota bacterium]MDA1164071.1 cytochrome P450 [Planctomycetota bacterium]